jgi:AcrR family transcriptional regulator
MPRHRDDLDRDEKIEQILDAAEAQIRSGGFAELSVARVAREVGVATNSVYWYFPSKDELFVAAVRRMFLALPKGKPRADAGLVTQVLWFVDRLAALAGPRTDLVRRADESPVAAELAAELTGHLHRMLAHALEPYVPAAQRDLAVRTFAATVDGSAALPRAERRRLLTYALERLTSG